MLEYYLGSLAFGGVLILASLVFGDSDVDADADVDVDADFDADFDADADIDHDIDAGEMVHIDDPADMVVSRWNPILSMRFWTFALATFGLTGTLLTMIGTPAIVTGVLAFAMGLGLGIGTAWMFHKLSREQISSKTTLSGIRGVHATVLLPLRPEGMGKVRLLVDEQQVDVLARTTTGTTLDAKSTVLVVNIEDGIANVTCLPEDYREPSKE